MPHTLCIHSLAPVTAIPFTGNPLAEDPCADGPGTRQVKTAPREGRLSGTVFATISAPVPRVPRARAAGAIAGRASCWLLLVFAAAAAAAAEPVTLAEYRTLLDELDARVDFERLPPRPEPGFNLDQPLYSGGAWIGERFLGQERSATDTGHDAIMGAPEGPWLRIEGGAPGRNLSVAWHRGFGSNALFPLGPAGFPALPARGEGAAAILFDTDQPAIGFRIHTDYPAPLGAPGSVQGAIEVTLYGRDGRSLGRFTHHPGPGISEFGYRRSVPGPAIAGVLIVNTDPGGIAIDDIIFAMPRPLG